MKLTVATCNKDQFSMIKSIQVWLFQSAKVFVLKHIVISSVTRFTAHFHSWYISWYTTSVLLLDSQHVLVRYTICGMLLWIVRGTRGACLIWELVEVMTLMVAFLRSSQWVCMYYSHTYGLTKA